MLIKITMDRIKDKGKNVYHYIEEKYGKFNKKNLKKFIGTDFSNTIKNISKENYTKILEQIDKLLLSQGLHYKDIQYLGEGQSFATLGIGNAVLKIGKVFPEYSEVLEIPYRLNPVYHENLKDDIGIYVSQRAGKKHISEKEVQNMYNRIRENDGLWLDVKANNLGYVEHKIDFSDLYPETTNYQFDHTFPPYDGNIFIMDYEDVIFLTPDLKQKIIEGYGMLKGCNVTSIPPQLLQKEENLDTIFYEAFIKRSKILMKYEINYQKAKGNFALASKYKEELKEMIKGAKQREHKKIYTAKEIGTQILARTRLGRIQEMVHKIKLKREEKEQTQKLDDSNLSLDVIEKNKTDDDPFQTL